MTDQTVSREEYERVVWELTKSASRFDYCAAMLEESFSASGTRRAEMIIKAKHFALEARAAMETIHD